MLKFPIYMDCHATTPVDPRALAAMLPYFCERYGNAASRSHSYGWAAEDAVEKARKQIATLIGASAKEIVFTSGATESNNLAIKGVARSLRDSGDHIITAVTEHKGVIDSCRRLEEDGCRVTYLPVQPDGRVDVDRVANTITDRTILISIMTANNEIGVVQPIAEIAAIANARGVVFHTDGVQALGKIPFDVNVMRVDLASFTAHKMYGPKGVGVLYVRRRTPRLEVAPLIDGGGHERGMRSGTLNVPGIVGFGEAAELCRKEMVEEASRIGGMRDRLLRRLREHVPDIVVNGSMEHRLPHNLNVSIGNAGGASLVMELTDVALSSGSACGSANAEPSYVLKALGLSDELAHQSIRFGLGRYTTVEEVDYVAEKLAAVVVSRRTRSS